MKALSSATLSNTPPLTASTPLIGSSPYRLKQVSRIIRHLRDQLQRSRPQLLTPSDGGIEAMLEDCPAILLSGDDWQQVIEDILTHLNKRFKAQAALHQPRLHCGRSTQLHETFTVTDALTFTSALLEHNTQAVS